MAFQDAALAQMVMNAISQDKRIGGQPILVRAANGEVALKGWVDNAEQKELARLVAQGIPGVRHVNIEELLIREDGESR